MQKITIIKRKTYCSLPVLRCFGCIRFQFFYSSKYRKKPVDSARNPMCTELQSQTTLEVISTSFCEPQNIALCNGDKVEMEVFVVKSGEQPWVAMLLLHRYSEVSEHCHLKTGRVVLGGSPNEINEKI